MNEEFHSEYMNQFWKEDPFDRRLHELAWDYLTKTEDYDWTICTRRRGKFAFGVTRDERLLSLEHANHCLNLAIDILRSDGYASASLGEELLDKIRDVRPIFESSYEPPIAHWREIPEISP